MPQYSFHRPAWLIVISTCLVSTAVYIPIDGAAQPQPLPLNVQRVLNNISVDSLRGNLSFLASDALKGRYTPSPELDVAAEFIAAQFRKAGLEPGGDQEYFQIARMVRRQFGQPGAVTIHSASKEWVFPATDVFTYSANHSVAARASPVQFIAAPNADLLNTMNVDGRVVIVPEAPHSLANDILDEGVRKRLQFARALETKHAIALLWVSRGSHFPASLLFEGEANQPGVPQLGISGEAASAWLKQLENGPHKHPSSTEASEEQRISFDLQAPRDETFVLKNVVGILRGSDLALKDTAVVVSAHYDHIGTSETAGRFAMTPATAQDRIYNGANDDGSGTVSVIEIASALARLRPPPKRSIVFVAFFGEEIGELGSRWFAAHPPFPMAETVAGVNLEQVGRTDSNHGPQLAALTVTGFDFSNITTYLRQAGRYTGVRLYKDEQSDAFFDRSDNTNLASNGVPAHTVSTAFVYPDYHGVGDEWQKIDYPNMAKVDRTVALAVLDLANASDPPFWNASNARTATYRQAQREARRAESGSTR